MNLSDGTRSERHKGVRIYVKFKNGQNRSRAFAVTVGEVVTDGTHWGSGDWPCSSSSSGHWAHECVPFVKFTTFTICALLCIYGDFSYGQKILDLPCIQSLKYCEQGFTGHLHLQDLS